MIVERIFNIPGMGWLAYTAIAERDYTQVLATTLMLTVGVITINLLGQPDNGVVASGYVGSLLVAGAFLAIGSALSAGGVRPKPR